jgi:hypothetical protein
VLAIYTHYYAAFILLFQILFLVVYRQHYRSRWPRLICWLIVMGALVFPIIFLMFPGGRYAMVCAEGAGRNPLRLFSIPYAFFTFSLGFSYGPSVAELHRSTTWATVRPYLFQLLPAGILFLTLSIMGLRSLRKQRAHLVFVVLYLTIPIAGACLVSLLMPQLSFNVRYVSMVLPAYGLILTRGLLFSSRKLLRWGLTLLVLVFVIFSISNYYTAENYAKENYRLAVQIITEGATKGDVILATHLRPIKYYYRGYLPIHNLLWSPTFHRKMIDSRLRPYKRAWVVMGRSWITDPEGKMLDYLRSTHSAVRETTFTHLYIGLFDTKVSRENSLARNREE